MELLQHAEGGGAVELEMMHEESHDDGCRPRHASLATSKKEALELGQRRKSISGNNANLPMNKYLHGAVFARESQRELSYSRQS